MKLYVVWDTDPGKALIDPLCGVFLEGHEAYARQLADWHADVCQHTFIVREIEAGKDLDEATDLTDDFDRAFYVARPRQGKPDED